MNIYFIRHNKKDFLINSTKIISAIHTYLTLNNIELSRFIEIDIVFKISKTDKLIWKEYLSSIDQNKQFCILL